MNISYKGVMSFEGMLNHRCDIYHINRTDESPGYSLPSSPSFSYTDAPDIKDLKCHFSLKSGSTVGLNVSQKEPYASLSGHVKLALPIGTDVRLNDKIINLNTEHTAEAPIQIRNHHIVVMLRRITAQEKL